MDVTSQAFWLFVAQMLQGVGQIGAVVVAYCALRLVQNYTRKKDAADFIRNRWNEQAQLNLLCIQNDEALATHEKIVYGQEPVDQKHSRRYFVIFAMINQIQHLYIALKHGILDQSEFESNALETVRLLKREQSTVTYLLTERGYAGDFRNAILPLFKKAVAPEFPPAASTELSMPPAQKS